MAKRTPRKLAIPDAVENVQKLVQQGMALVEKGGIGPMEALAWEMTAGQILAKAFGPKNPIVWHIITAKAEGQNRTVHMEENVNWDVWRLNNMLAKLSRLKEALRSLEQKTRQQSTTK